MNVEEIIKIVDNYISDLSASGAIDFLEELTGEIETRIAGLECDLDFALAKAEVELKE